MQLKRSILFFCIMLCGISLDAYWSWYAFHFEAACSLTREVGPWPGFLFTAASLVAAGASLIFRRNRIYVLICLAVCALNVVMQGVVIAEVRYFEGLAGVNCYRRVGNGVLMAFILHAIFSLALLGITLIFGLVDLASRWLHRAPRQTPPHHEIQP